MYFEFQTTAWQSLPEYGVSLFVVKFMNQRKEELLGVAFNRLMRMDMTTGDHIKTWRFNTMKVYRISHRDTKSPCRMLTRWMIDAHRRGTSTGKWNTWWSSLRRRTWFSVACRPTARWCTNSSVATSSCRCAPKKPTKLSTKSSSTNWRAAGLRCTTNLF